LESEKAPKKKRESKKEERKKERKEKECLVCLFFLLQLPK
jgi:hypothetical protein